MSYSDGFPDQDDEPVTFSANRVVGDVNPQGADHPAQRLVDTTVGAGLFTTNSDPNVVGVDPLTGEDAPVGTDVGFAAVLRDKLVTGLYNASFTLPPPDITQNIDDSNLLPYWELVQVSGSAVSATWSAGTGTPGEVTLALAAGAAGDDGALQQLHAINRSAYQDWAYAISGYVSNSVTATANAYLEGQFLQDDAVTTTGSAVRVEANSGTFTVVMGATPTDAVYLRVRAGIERDALADSGTASRRWSEVAVHGGPETLYLSNHSATMASINAGGLDWVTIKARASSTPSTQVGHDPDVQSPLRVFNSSSDLIGALPIGLAPYAFPLGYAQNMVSTAGSNLSTVAAGLGGARAIPILVPSIMLVESCTIWNTDTASLRTAEWALYWDRGDETTDDLGSVHDAFGGSALGTFSFTPGGAASLQWSTISGGPLRIAPGLYWLIIRNTSTARTFGLGSVAAGSLAGNHSRFVGATEPSLTITIDISGWTASTSIYLARLDGRIGAEAVAF